MEVTEDEAAKIEAEEAAKKAGKPPATEPTEEKKEGEEEGESKGQKPNAGNGGITELYSWEQTLKDVTVNIKIPAGLKGKDLNVTMTGKHAKI